MTTSNQNHEHSITATHVPVETGNEGAAFLQTLFGDHAIDCILGERLIFQWARKIIEGYAGGQWCYFKLSNGSGFSMPSGDGPVNVTVDSNLFFSEMSREAAGIVVTLYALNHMVWRLAVEHDGRAERIQQSYELLRDYVSQHQESRLINAAID